ncbi:uncharacterized protein LOC118603816 isoform X4 [Rousettus aegyptiacus]|uniref:uncharacterized protein LOC118603816 isoform X4 n=1 Tax=Rousettus aegyptiacus TaxID=9407 RepID=UPI00168D7163|nr:uncharacterized protein LOC118603816 isoform X4 [Rousettus aegyptiacus]
MVLSLLCGNLISGGFPRPLGLLGGPVCGFWKMRLGSPWQRPGPAPRPPALLPAPYCAPSPNTYSGPERAASTDRRPPSAEACNLRGLSHCRRLERVNVPSDTGAEGSYRPCTLRLGAQRPISRRTRPARFPHPLFLPLLVWKPQDASFRHTCHLTNSVFSVANQLGRGTLLEQRRTEGRVLSRARGCQGRSQPCPPVSPVLLRDLQPPAVPAPAFPSTPSSPVWGPPCLFMFLMKAR